MSEEVKPVSEVTIKAAKMNYYLFMANVLVPFTSLVAMLIAKGEQKKNPEAFLESHYQLQVRSFWISLAYLVIAGISTFVLIGLLLFLLMMFWHIYRGIKGLQALESGQPHPNPTTWMW